MNKGRFRNIDHGLINKPLGESKFCESFAQVHMFLKLLEYLQVEMISMGEQSVKSSYYCV